MTANTVCLWQLRVKDADFSDQDFDEAFGPQNAFWGVHPNPDTEFLHIWALTPTRTPANEAQKALIDRFYYNDEAWDKEEDVQRVSLRYSIVAPQTAQ